MADNRPSHSQRSQLVEPHLSKPPHFARRPGILLSPVTVGAWRLPNRMVMAPLTRQRAGEGNVPTPLMAQYYRQRASAGLIVSEGSQISPGAVGYLHTPGIHSDAQVAGWRLVTSAVHEAGGCIVLQLWHAGRISHPSLQPGGALPVAPSAIRPAGQAHTAGGRQRYLTPRALAREEIAAIVAQFAQGARRAREAGFDGVEIHGANGYLIDQFLRGGTNRRSDRYGGSAANRARLLREVAEAVIAVWGAGRVGVRVSPTRASNDMHDADPVQTFSAAARALDALPLAYLHVVEPAPGSREYDPAAPRVLPAIRAVFPGPIIVNAGYTAEAAEAALAQGDADLVAFGRLFLANPDLVERFRRGAPLNPPDPATFYGGDEHGYTDYPTCDAKPAMEAPVAVARQSGSVADVPQ